MADISISRNHEMDMGVLRQRLDELAADLKSKYGVRYRWEGDQILLDGSGVKNGVVNMTASSVSIDVTLGMMARLLKPKIEEEINRKIVKVLAP